MTLKDVAEKAWDGLWMEDLRCFLHPDKAPMKVDRTMDNRLLQHIARLLEVHGFCPAPDAVAAVIAEFCCGQVLARWEMDAPCQPLALELHSLASLLDLSGKPSWDELMEVLERAKIATHFSIDGREGEPWCHYWIGDPLRSMLYLRGWLDGYQARAEEGRENG